MKANQTKANRHHHHSRLTLVRDLRRAAALAAVQSCLIPAILLLAGALPVRANLILHIDPANDTFYFTGSDSGSRDQWYNIAWVFGSSYSGPAESVDGIGAGVDFSPNADLQDQVLISYSSGTVALLFLAREYAPIYNATGNGTSFSYASFSSERKSVIESMIGGEMSPLDTDTLQPSNWSPIQVVGVPDSFSAFDASKLRIWLGPPSSFQLQSSFTLSGTSDGINPLTELVTLQIGTLTLTLPAGSFQPNKRGDAVFTGVVDGVSFNLKFEAARNGNWVFKANASNANLAGTANPVTVRLSIGDDSGMWTGNVPIN